MATVETLTPVPVPTTPGNLQVTGEQTKEKHPTVTVMGLEQEDVTFDPSKHLEYTPPSKVCTMSELGYPESRGVSPIGVSEPFPLFSAEAMQQMRKEVLSDEVFAKYQYSSELAQCQLRGYASEQVYLAGSINSANEIISCAAFVYDAWRYPEALAIVSKIAGVDLVSVMDFEIGHVNISVSSETEKTKALTDALEQINNEASEGASGEPWEDRNPIVDWHTDSYPFVCVTMLSDCNDMIGGETALRKGNGEVVEVRGPQMVSQLDHWLS